MPSGVAKLFSDRQGYCGLSHCWPGESLSGWLPVSGHRSCPVGRVLTHKPILCWVVERSSGSMRGEASGSLSFCLLGCEMLRAAPTQPFTVSSLLST